jgi:hypothetical protein
MIKKNQIAKDVRVVLNSNFRIKSLSDEYLACESILFVSEGVVYNDTNGEYVLIKGGSFTNSGRVYLREIDLEFPIGNKPIYSHQSIDYNKDLSEFKSIDEGLKYGDFVKMNDRFESIHIWSEDLEKLNNGRWIPRKITEEKYYEEIGTGE